ncbi:MAG: hypothetical protein A2177_15560 [Spirochaetes bacterium RBG_13_68_11]|nr:MAG: hypothetical protein A2177_15560 [Spirochaetes bacterium RBG_13_68_11]
MVKTIHVLVLALAALACLAGCYLGAGIFPDRLMSYEAYASLTRFIDPNHAEDYRFQIIRNSSSGAEYLVLANDDGSFGDDCVVVFNTDLKTLGHYTLDELNALDEANPFSGRGAMVDESGCIVVGNRRFTVGPRNLAYASTPPTLGAYGLAIPGQPNPNIGNIYCFGTALRYSRYLADWTFQPPEVNSTIGGGSNYKVACFGLSGTNVVMVIWRSGPVAEIFQLPQDLFSSGTLCTPLDTHYPATPPVVPTPNEIEWQTLGYTEEGFAAFRWTHQYIRFDESGATIGTPLDVPDDKDWPYDQRHVYGKASGWYIFDTKEMSIERRAWWWQ